jgi:hypothetical protein
MVAAYRFVVIFVSSKQSHTSEFCWYETKSIGIVLVFKVSDSCDGLSILTVIEIGNKQPPKNIHHRLYDVLNDYYWFRADILLPR